MKEISEFTETRIKRDTKNTLYWLKRTTNYLKEGDAKAAHQAILNTLGYVAQLAYTQTRIEDMVEPDWAGIYDTCLNQAVEELEKDGYHD